VLLYLLDQIVFHLVNVPWVQPRGHLGELDVFEYERTHVFKLYGLQLHHSPGHLEQEAVLGARLGMDKGGSYC